MERLRAEGFDVTMIGTTIPGASDDDALAIASKQNRILITEDRDFGELVVRQRREFAALPRLNWIAYRMWRRSVPCDDQQRGGKSDGSR